MGEGDLPFAYKVYEAAKVLNCSFMELLDHPDRLELMSLAFTIERGENEGRYLQQVNPQFQEQLKTAAKEIAKVKESVR